VNVIRRFRDYELRGFPDHAGTDGANDDLVRFSPRLALADTAVLHCAGFASTFGAGLWLSALNVKYRDFRYLIPFIVQFGLYASPVGFSSEKIPENWRLLYACNPIVRVIDGFRWASVISQ
jgi:lipopolysaccharide transport system permease protein